jgi:hypothetical protein
LGVFRSGGFKGREEGREGIDSLPEVWGRFGFAEREEGREGIDSLGERD